MKKTIHPIVFIEWIDSCTSDTDWKDIRNAKGITHCYSVGFKVKETKKYIVLFPNLNNNTNPLGCCDITIPKGAIKSIKEIKL
jgi:hypothetical protein